MSAMVAEQKFFNYAAYGRIEYLRRGKMSSKNSVRQGEMWTVDEVRTLKRIFRNSSNTTVATTLNRSPKAVERKASKLGLTKTKKYLRSIGRPA